MSLTVISSQFKPSLLNSTARLVTPSTFTGMLGERGLGWVVHFPLWYVARINSPWPWPCHLQTEATCNHLKTLPRFLILLRNSATFPHLYRDRDRDRDFTTTLLFTTFVIFSKDQNTIFIFTTTSLLRFSLRKSKSKVTRCHLSFYKNSQCAPGPSLRRMINKVKHSATSKISQPKLTRVTVTVTVTVYLF